MSKKAIPNNLSDWVYRLGTVVIPSGIYYLIINSGMPAIVVDLCASFKLAHFLLTTLVFLLLFQSGNRFARIAACALCAVLFALPMAINLTNGISSATMIGGFIPYKDGFYYYNGANMLLAGERITPLGLQGAFRPLFPGWLSVLLLITNQNLLMALGLMILITAYCVYFAAESLRQEYGPLPAALFFTLTYAFIRPMLGETLTELPSLAFACLSLVLLIKTSKSGKFLDAVLGGMMLVLAVSIRAGAFFILPFLVFWLGWRLRGEKKISLKIIMIYGVILLAIFLIANMIFTRLTTEQGDSTFGNFSWMLYGQAVGGAGFNHHLVALGTHDADVVIQAALERIRTYPLGLLIGFAKSYRDFFTNNSLGMFDLLSGENAVMRWIFWLLMIGLLVYGLYKSLRKAKEPLNALLLVCFFGLLLSIPFLPPIDGGNRFYSGNVPLLFALMSIHLPSLDRKYEKDKNIGEEVFLISRCLAILFTLALLLGPLLILNLRKSQEAAKLAECDGALTAVQVEYPHGSYVDILPDDSTACGSAPEICLSRFASHGEDYQTDDFYNLLVDKAENSSLGIRVWAGVEWNSNQYAFILLPLDLTGSTESNQRYNACAHYSETQFQRVLEIQAFE